MNSREPDIPPFVNVSTMGKLLGLSRSRLYQLINQGVLLQPVYLVSNKRPAYTREMVVRNLEVKHSNVGVNGKIVMFYSARASTTSPKAQKTVKKGAKQSTALADKYADLMDAFEGLGFEGITASDIDSAIQKCFPDGAENFTEGYVLREIFPYLKCRDSEHNPRT